MNLRFAFAVNEANEFEEKYFGEAEKYIIYERKADKMELSSVEINRFKSLNKEQEHGSIRKGNAIIKFLKEKDVNILVSRQFGKNIILVKEHFIPVRISLEHPDEVIDILNKHLHWIEDEWKNNKSNFKLFTVKSGILKSSIED